MTEGKEGSIQGGKVKERKEESTKREDEKKIKGKKKD